MSVSDMLVFIREWLRDPRSVAALAPSGKALASLITREISPRTGRVLELGPGTGVFTQALIARGVREENLTLVECNADFAEMLERRFPNAQMLEIDAEQLGRIQTLREAPVGAIVCGLGLLNMPQHKVKNIMKGAFSCLRTGGELFLFTYGPDCPVSRVVLTDLGLQASRVGRVYLNLPPAAVYRIRRSA
ncbi:methyltransferase domain-containing protein [Rhizobium sp. VS19-DR104.2]|uniref:class I SAM-dependent methyltransferase n=1 Tax=unclassified Rhizobium TaxID=2613769 RepID=UPI001CC495B9|nr:MULTISPECIES: methyltransferase domain-containing protein [unclassified Rhizobium]MBZ5762941.1 methyltransferase domain-containing protein [Rhizobium sp. VS19-DR96]MBZ5768774.1 methyltransferase domain-containing protein [Rhizobium sp. VS19-DR129.2]MBZ5776390.1 methyltransferase domain-containing protein [Rhizobium sp. VS19-DRK62.2]MBZ5787597.1 methyltransferase domain-containing protein [Rhizobium sp. VS19-DR121]MBZ5804952.1 methyltransferase domain-containing protein [Rhizobium sp. VS19-D